MKALINTKSNFRNLNNSWQKVCEISGNRVTCIIYDENTGHEIKADFSMSEIKQFSYKSN